MRAQAFIAGTVVVLALTAAGCGGDGGTSAEETWAGEVCTSIASWRTEVETIASDTADTITKPGATLADLKTAVQTGLDATRQLIDELGASVPPDTPEGAQAEAAVDAFLADVRASDDEVQKALADLPDDAGLSEAVTALSGLATNVQETVERGRTLITELSELGDALKDGFDNAEACQQLRTESS